MPIESCPFAVFTVQAWEHSKMSFDGHWRIRVANDRFQIEEVSRLKKTAVDELKSAKDGRRSFLYIAGVD